MRLMNLSFGATHRALLVAVACSVFTTGCLEKMGLNAFLGATRDGSHSLNTFQDFEIAREATAAGLGQLEGMHKLAPWNEDGLFMLARGWANNSYFFAEDSYEEAVAKGDAPAANYHLRRARAGFVRSLYFGQELLKRSDDGFDAATQDAGAMSAWLDDNFESDEDALRLLWVGFSWVEHAHVSKELKDVQARLFVGLEMLKRSLEIDENLEHGMAHTLLGAYGSDLAENEKHFKRALELNDGGFLPTKLSYATTFYCAKSDKAAYEKLLGEVLSATDAIPAARLPNTVAKRRARRYLGAPAFQKSCGFS